MSDDLSRIVDNGVRLRSLLDATPAPPAQIEIMHRHDGPEIVGSLVAMFTNPWLVMLALGGLHSYYPVVPAMAYWPTFLALYVIDVIGQTVRSSHRLWTKPRRK